VSCPIVIVGSGGHAHVVADIVALDARFTIAGFLDDVQTDRYGTAFAGSIVLGATDLLPSLAAQGVRHGFVAIGQWQARVTLAERLRESGFSLPVLRHPAATLARDVAVGDGSVLMAGAIVNPGARLGASVIVNTAASVDHDCEIDDGVHIAPGARLAGHVHVGRGAWIGIGAVVKDRVRIGAGSMIGAGAVVVKDVPEGVVAFGNPATVVRRIIDVETAAL
jgi:UDP-N-acetylbacillosamine N-acetyltransferase